MIVRAKTIPKVYSFTCDQCSSEFLETDKYTFGAAMADFREAGWVVVNVTDGDEYEHFCPGCARKNGVD